MNKFAEMQAFVAVVEAGSFVQAADDLQLSKPAMTRHLANLESRLGVRLLHRTTRKLSLTEEGSVFYARCQTLLAAVTEAEAEISSRAGEASGLIRINVPLSFGIMHLAPIWGEFQKRHPKVTLDITLNDRVIDLVEEGFDLAIRIAQLPSSSLISRKLASTRAVVCAAPSYLTTYGEPTHPADLATHRVIAYNQLATGDEWTFQGPDGLMSVMTYPVMHTNSGDTCRHAALCGHGLVMQPDFLVGEDLRSGALVEVLPEYRGSEFGIYALYPSRKFVTPKVRLMIDFLIDQFREIKWR